MLAKSSQVIDKAMTVVRERMSAVIGRLDGDEIVEVERWLAAFLGIAK